MTSPILRHISAIVWQVTGNEWGPRGKWALESGYTNVNSKVQSNKHTHELSEKEKCPLGIQCLAKWGLYWPTLYQVWLRRYRSRQGQHQGHCIVECQVLEVRDSTKPRSLLSPVPARRSVQLKYWAHTQRSMLLYEALGKNVTWASVKLRDCPECEVFPHSSIGEGLTAEFLSVSWNVWVWVTPSHNSAYSEGLPELCWRQPLSSPLPMCLSFKNDHMYWLFPRAVSSVLTDPS